MNYRFEVVFEKKNLTPELNVDCEEFIEHWVKRLGLHRISETKVVRATTDDTDLTKACLLAGEMGDRNEFFKKVIISDLVENDVEVVL